MTTPIEELLAHARKAAEAQRLQRESAAAIAAQVHATPPPPPPPPAPDQSHG